MKNDRCSNLTSEPMRRRCLGYSGHSGECEYEPDTCRMEFEYWAEAESDYEYPLERMSRNQDFYRDSKSQHAWDGWREGRIRLLRKQLILPTSPSGEGDRG